MSENDQPGTRPDEATGERFHEPVADRAPTQEEERAAERAAQSVDVEETAEHFEEAARIGANVRGEGEIEPPTPR